MPPLGFESTISAGERPQTYALDRAATGTGIYKTYNTHYIVTYILQHNIYLEDQQLHLDLWV